MKEKDYKNQIDICTLFFSYNKRCCNNKFTYHNVPQKLFQIKTIYFPLYYYAILGEESFFYHLFIYLIYKLFIYNFIKQLDFIFSF